MSRTRDLTIVGTRWRRRPMRDTDTRTLAVATEALGLPIPWDRNGDLRTLCHVGVPDEHPWTSGRWERLRDRLPSRRRRRAA